MNEFFEEIFKGKPNDQWITLWKLNTKKTYWFLKTTDFELKSEELSLDEKEGDIYFGLGTSKNKGTSNSRIKAKDVHGIGCIHLDIDYGEDGHKGKGLPPNSQEAIKIAQIILNPSYIVQSGNGIHAYYLLDEYKTSKNALETIADLQRIFQKTTNCYTEYNVDMTHDLSRVLRIPGSINYKDPKNPKECKVLIDNSMLRYSIKDIEEAISQITNYKEPKKKQYKQTTIEIPDFTKEYNTPEIKDKAILYNSQYSTPEKYKIINQRLERTPNRKLDPEKFYELKDIFGTDFDQVYTHTKEMADGSNSPYDMALANFACQMDFDEQEICDLLIQHRKFHKGDLKLTHPSYYGMTIYKAWLWYESQKSKEEQLKTINQIKKPEETKNTETSSDAIDTTIVQKELDEQKEQEFNNFQQKVQSTLKLKIDCIYKYDQDPEPKYTLKFEDQTKLKPLRLGTYPKAFQSKTQFSNKLKSALMGTSFYNNCNFNISKQQWINLMYWFNQITKTIITEENVFFENQLKDWITELRHKSNEQTEVDEFDNRPGEVLFLDPVLWFDIKQLHKYIKQQYDAHMDINSLRNYLHDAGARKNKLNKKDCELHLWNINEQTLQSRI